MLLDQCIKFCMICSAICSMACSPPLHSSLEKIDANKKQEIETYMQEFISMYMSEACDEKQKIYMKSQDIYTDNFDSPVELTVYTNDRGEDVRYRVEIYGETGKSVTDYYLCENFIYVNREREYYSSPVLRKGYDDILYRQTDDWIIMEDDIYILQDNGDMKADTELPFFSIEEVNEWAKELENL